VIENGDCGASTARIITAFLSRQSRTNLTKASRPVTLLLNAPSGVKVDAHVSSSPASMAVWMPGRAVADRASRGRRQADITKLLNGLVTGYSSDVQNVHSREAVVILEEIHDARFGPPGRTIPSPATCSTAAW
jgi:hypothetical protein